MKFTVIIPVYNVAEYVNATLNSVYSAALKYSGGDVEIICVDDGSTDRSPMILDEFKNSIARSHPSTVGFNVIHQENAGVSAARNKALDVATGDYICFVDGDDGVVEDYFNRLHEILVDHQPDVVKFGFYSVQHLNEPSVNDVCTKDVRSLDMSSESGAVAGFKAIVGSTWAWNAVYRRLLLSKIRFKKYPNGEDILFATDVSCAAKSLAIADDVLYLYVSRPKSAARSINPKRLISCCDSCVAMAESTAKWNYGALVKNWLNRRIERTLVMEVVYNINCIEDKCRDAVWTSFFNAITCCAWSPFAKIVARTHSRFLTILLLRNVVKFYVAVQRIRKN